MKNYPNQAVDLSRIRSTLGVIDRLSPAARLDDGQLGVALARAGAYTFRGMRKNPTARAVTTRIATEAKKAPSNQGTRTFAREMRRTLRDLGWLTGKASLTTAGQAFLGSAPGSREEQSALRTGLLRLTVGDTTISHPVQILLYLLAISPSHHREGLELTLEATDDSDGELLRIAALYGMSEVDRRASMSVKAAQVANAKKVFPALAEAAGLIDRDLHGNYSITAAGLSALARPGSAPVRRARTAGHARQTRVQRLRTVTEETIASLVLPVVSYLLTRQEQTNARRRLVARLSRHQAGLREFTKRLSSPGQLQEADIDLLWTPPSTLAVAALLVEFKTIDGDDVAQVRAGVGQLLLYKFTRQESDSTFNPSLALVVDGPIAPSLHRFLEQLGIAAICSTPTKCTALNQAARALSGVVRFR